MKPGSKPRQLSQKISRRLQNIDVATNIVSMCWQDRSQRLHVFVTPLDSTVATTHYIWEIRTGAWWPVTFNELDHNPKCVHLFDGDDPDDRVVLMGSWDGYMRMIDETAEDDDGETIDSHVLIGPLVTKELDELMVRDLQFVMGADSGEVTWELFTGNNAETALAKAQDDDEEPDRTGTLTSGRNLTELVRQAGYASYIKLKAQSAWQLELIRAGMERLGKVRARGL
jgi:hypothetical protein